MCILPVCRNGRRDRLKICCPQGRVGSSPTTGTSTEPVLADAFGNFSLAESFLFCGLIFAPHDSFACGKRNQAFGSTERQPVLADAFGNFSLAESFLFCGLIFAPHDSFACGKRNQAFGSTERQPVLADAFGSFSLAENSPCSQTYTKILDSSRLWGIFYQKRKRRYTYE